MSNQTVVEVAADTTGYVASLMKAQKSAADFITSQDRVKKYTENAVTAIDQARNALNAQGNAAVDAFNKSSKQAESFLKSIQKQADQAGKTTAELQRMRAAELGVGAAAEQYIAQMEKANEAAGHLAHGAGGARREMLVLAHEASQGNWKNFGGSLMVLGEQMDILKYLLNPVALGIAAVAAASYVAYEAVHKLTEQQKEINGAMVLTSNYADLSQGSLLAYSNTISKDLKVSTGTASEALLDMAKSGMVAGADLVQVSEGIVAYSKISGESVSDVSKMFEQSYGSAAEAAKKWAATHHDLTKAQLENIEVMEKSGDKAGAWKEFVVDASANARKAVLADNHAMSDSYESLGQKWERFWRTVTGKGDQLTKLQDNLAALNALENDPDSNPGGRNTADYEAQRKQIQAQIDSILNAKNAQDEQTKALDRFNSMNEQHIEGMKKEWTWQQKLADANKTAKDRIDALTTAAKAAGKFTPQYAAQLQSDLQATLAANGREFHAPKGEATYHEPRGVSLLDEAKAQQAVLQQSLTSNGQLTGWAAKRAALEEQIANYAGQTLTKQQASVLANKDALLSQYKVNESLEADAEFIKNVNKLTTDRDQLNDKLQQQNDSLAQQHQIELQTATLTNEQRKRQIDLLQIETARQKELSEWANKATALKLTGSDTDQEERRTINQKYDDRSASTQQFFDAQDAMKGDWISGAKTGLASLIEQTSNLNQLAQSTATSFASGIGDAFAEIATTGKLSFGDLAKSVVASFIKMETEALAARAAMSFLNWFGGGAATGTDSLGGGIASGVGDLLSFAGGGMISGPGTGTSDSILARVSNGEGILTAATVQRIGGAPAIEALNNGAAVHSMARFASGGTVGAATGAVSGSGGGGSTVFNITLPAASGGGSPQYSQGQIADLERVLKGWVNEQITKSYKQGGQGWTQRVGRV